MKDFQDTTESFSPQREHPELQNMKFLHFFQFLWVIFAILDPDPKPANHQNKNPNLSCTVPYL